MSDNISRPTAEDCTALLSELRMTPMQAAIGISARGFFVLIYASVKRPPMIRFRGWPIEYRIGGGMPVAYNV